MQAAAAGSDRVRVALTHVQGGAAYVVSRRVSTCSGPSREADDATHAPVLTLNELALSNVRSLLWVVVGLVRGSARLTILRFAAYRRGPRNRGGSGGGASLGLRGCGAVKMAWTS